MKSKVKFDLHGDKDCIIAAKVAYSDDVRDKVACKFKEGFGHSSNLAFVYMQESVFLDHELMGDNSVAVGTIDNKCTAITILPYAGTLEASRDLVNALSSEQRANLLQALMNHPVPLQTNMEPLDNGTRSW